jgi:hypothetical protein
MDIKIPLPKQGKILVKEDQKINFNQPIFEASTERNIEVDIASSLKIHPSKIFTYLKKFIEDEVKENDVLAERKTFFGTKKAVSPQSGKIKEINHETGIVIISALIDKKTIYSYFSGKVKTIEKNTMIVSLTNAKEYPIKNASDDFGGECFFFLADVPIDAELIENKILVTKSINSLDQTKIEALGAKGIVTIKPLPNQSEIYFCYMKNLPDFEAVAKRKFFGCTVIKNESRIYFYD